MICHHPSSLIFCFHQDDDSKRGSRLALRQLFWELYPQLSWPEIKQLDVVNYQYINSFPQWRISLAHTKGLAVAALANQSQFLSLGVDIEWAERSLPRDSERHFLNTHDHYGKKFGKKIDLSLWCLKEAAFKALHPFQNYWLQSIAQRPLLLKDIWIKGEEFGLLTPQCAISPSLGHLSYQIWPWGHKKILMALATIDTLQQKTLTSWHEQFKSK